MATEGGTFVSAAGGTFETVISGTIKPLPSGTLDNAKDCSHHRKQNYQNRFLHVYLQNNKTLLFQYYVSFIGKGKLIDVKRNYLLNLQKEIEKSTIFNQF